jgi:hypothetical protein
MKYKSFKRILSILLTMALVFGMIGVPDSPVSLVGEVEASTHVNVQFHAFFGSISASNSPQEPSPARRFYMNPGDFLEFQSTQFIPSSANFSVALVRADGLRIQGLSPTFGTFNGTITIPSHPTINRSGWYRIEIRSTSASNVTYAGVVAHHSRISNRTARIRRCASFGGSGSTPPSIEQTLTNRFNNATAGLRNTFGISFALQNNGIQHSALLTGVDCPSLLVDPCNPALGCARLDWCYRGPGVNTNHHRSDDRLLDITFGAFSGYTMRVVGHALCYWDGRNHLTSGGIASMPWTTVPRQSLVTSVSAEPMEFLMQHELSHNLGAPDDHGGSVECVISFNFTVLNKLCNSCEDAIWTNKTN